MVKKMKESRIILWLGILLLVATLILVLSKIQFLFAPIGTFISTLFTPVVAAGFLYYLLNPIVNLLEKVKIKRGLGILIVFLALILALVGIVMTVIPNLVSQITSLVNNLPEFIRELQHLLAKASEHPWLRKLNLESLLQGKSFKPSTLAKNSLMAVTSNLGSVVSMTANIVINLITIPVILFYFLRDGYRFGPNIQRFFPERFRSQVGELLHKMNATISRYFAGQMIECLFVGTFTFIGYTILGMPYAFLLGFIAGIANIIPYLGPYIGIAPALIIAFTISFPKAIAVVIVVLIVQQVDGNFIYPNVVGKALNIHPLTIILILLAAGNLAGLLGMILAIPVYAVAKTVVTYMINLYRLSRETDISEPEIPIDGHDTTERKDKN
ncbi:AI-2E family transporter [Agrilactobacillus fermenti]|uniref:AI-2E family transporter n=1 Tax=Agrilactobacillus fermenti TaxID=2586909 RepID=UPI001E29CBB1|nr:AI-2E family transporter [Agrilactobacillus fermenti]MCD2255193.1 AI-2E family transporter [Agrilactobacillus fermenti]